MRVFTDGACSGNPGPGGWAWATDDGRQGSGGAEHTTNQRMELQAVLEAVTTLDEPIHIYSDSTYVVNCFLQKWYAGWLKRGWRNSQKKPVANRDLWEPLIAAYLERPEDVEFTWVKGHSGNEMNDLVDALAVAASKAIQAGGSGEGSSGSAAPVEAPWDRSSAVWVVGSTDADREQLAALERVIGGLTPGRDVLVSGLRRGAELSAAVWARRNQIELAVVLPFPDPAAGWPSDQRDEFDELVDQAGHVVTLDGPRSLPGNAVEARNRWTAETVSGAIVVGDPELGRLLDEQGLSVVPVD